MIYLVCPTIAPSECCKDLCHFGVSPNEPETDDRVDIDSTCLASWGLFSFVLYRNMMNVRTYLKWPEQTGLIYNRP